MTGVKNKYDISVIVCCYNGVDTIQMCLNSLLNQKFSDDQVSFEVLIVDDGSKDGSADVIKQYLNELKPEHSSIFRYYRKENEGLSIARNYGWERANSDLITYIDEDAIADEYFLKNIVTAFNLHPEANCVGGNVNLLNIESYFAQLVQDSIFSQFMNRENTVIGTNMSFRKSLLIKYGGFQPEFTYRADETVFFELSKNDLKIYKSDNIFVKHKQVDNKKKYFKVRYDNGWFGAAADSLFTFRGENRSMEKKFIISIFNMLAPLIIIVFAFLYPSIEVFLLSFLALIFLLLRRFIINNFLLAILNQFKRNRNGKYTFKEFFLIAYLVVAGRYVSDYGYFKGVINYKGQVWKTERSAR